MCFPTRSTTFRLPIFVTAAMVLALVGTAAVASASNTVDKDLAQTTIGKTTAPDTLREAGTAAPTPGLQMFNDDDDVWRGWWIIMPIMMVLVWGGVLGVAVWGIRQFTRERRDGRSPLDIAKERLARGEITKDEFDRVRGDLV